MEMVSLHDSLPLFSRLVYGMWRLNDDTDTSDGHIVAKVEKCLEQGITTMDHADIYGDYECEQLFGRALKGRQDLKDACQHVTKCDVMLLSDKFPERRVKHYDTSAAHILASAENSLNRLGLDVLDLLLVHRPDPFMDQLKRAAPWMTWSMPARSRRLASVTSNLGTGTYCKPICTTPW